HAAGLPHARSAGRYPVAPLGVVETHTREKAVFGTQPSCRDIYALIRSRAMLRRPRVVRNMPPASSLSSVWYGLRTSLFLSHPQHFGMRVLVSTLVPKMVGCFLYTSSTPPKISSSGLAPFQASLS